MQKMDPPSCADYMEKEVVERAMQVLLWQGPIATTPT